LSCAPSFTCVNTQLTHLDSPNLVGSSKIVFTIFHDRILHDKCLGRAEFDVNALLGLQQQRSGEGECLLVFKEPDCY
jgi:hypothetical protein